MNKVTLPARLYLVGVVDALLHPASEQLERHAKGNPKNAIHRASYGPSPRHLRSIRDALGSGGFPEFIRSSLALFSGQLGLSSGDVTQGAALLLRGLSAANPNPKLRLAFETEGARLPAGVAEILQFFDLTKLRAALLAAPDAELETARDHCRAAWEFVCGLAPDAPKAVPPVLYLLWFHLRFGYAPSRAHVEKAIAAPDWPLMREQFTAKMQEIRAQVVARTAEVKRP